MKKFAMLVTGATLSLAAAIPSHADVSANAGFVSDYYFRGANLGDGGVYGGVDYETGGFFAGIWAIDDGTGGNDGLENDWYLGYGGEAGSVSWGVGYTNYQYTSTKDYEHEIFASFGVGGFGFEAVFGRDEDDTNTTSLVDDGEGGFVEQEIRADSESYYVISASYEVGSFAATVGHYDMGDVDDSDYEWVELSFSGEVVEGIDATVSVGKQFSGGTDTDGYMVLDISKSFSL